nr:CHRD domain-containing protein [Herpetosiphonaceae bacterium]
EVEPNNTSITPQPLLSSGWITGSIDVDADFDFYSLALNAGDTVFTSLDADPERDGGTTWNPILGIGVINGFILTINDASTTSPPNSEAHFLTVKETGTYVIRVNSTTGFGAAFTYHLSVTVLPAASQASCTTYTSTDLPKALGPGAGTTTSELTIPGNPQISDLNVSLALTHTNMPDLDVQLSAPPGVGGNTVGLFSDIGTSTPAAMAAMNLTLDDEAAIPVNQYTVVSGLVVQPEFNYRLAWFDGQDAGGTWTLTLRDDTANTGGGNLLSWSLTVCSDPPLTACPAGSSLTTVYSSDFEATDGGFTHSGTADEWEWGTPSFAPITTSNSGANAWATDLDNTYDVSSNQDLLSPAIDLSGFSGPIFVSWAQKYQMQVATADHAFVDAQQVGGTTPQRLWEWLGATMTESVGSPLVVVQQSAGWGMHYADISAFAGQQLELRFHLDSDTTTNLAGLAIDDVTVSACVGGPTPTATEVTPTATTPPASCLTYQVAIDGAQEVPPSGSTATGSAAITIDTAANTLSYNITFSGLSSSELSAHIHGFAPPGANAGVLHTLPAGSPKIGVYNYNQADEANILAGLTYINIHSTNFPGGEIRGQIAGTPGTCVTPTPVTPTATEVTPTATTPPASCLTYQVALNGGQEVPPNGSTATGSAAITIDTAANTLSYNITFSGLSSTELSAHIHGFAPPGTNAGVLHTLPAGSPKIGVYNYNQADEANILAGLTYINIHSTNFPGGEIRGQIAGTPGTCVTPTPITPTAITPTATQTAITPTAITPTAITPTATQTVIQRKLYLPLILR